MSLNQGPYRFNFGFSRTIHKKEKKESIEDQNYLRDLS